MVVWVETSTTFHLHQPRFSPTSTPAIHLHHRAPPLPPSSAELEGGGGGEWGGKKIAEVEDGGVEGGKVKDGGG